MPIRKVPDNPLISVVMPLYNKRPYLRRAIDSVRKQTVGGWELIIVDDGSTDGSVDEIPRDDARIRLIRQSNRGPSAARNRGIGAAKSGLITFLDADDYYHDGKLETEISLLSEEKTADWMLSPFEREADGRVEVKKFRDPDNREFPDKTLLLDSAPSQLRLSGIHIDGLCVKKSLLRRIGGFNEEMRCFEITELIYRCALAAPRAVVFHQPLYTVVTVPGSAFSVSAHRAAGLKQLGESLHRLGTRYPRFSHLLSTRSTKNMLSYAAQLIRSGETRAARDYLTREYPFPCDRRWWKLWLAAWQPSWVAKKRYARIENSS